LGEHGAHIIEGARRAGMKRDQTYLASSHAEMIDALRANVAEHDIVLLKGSRKVSLDKVVEAMKEFFRRDE
jgi:UDP-N-acetylmuramyl pentapeptide synthase